MNISSCGIPAAPPGTSGTPARHLERLQSLFGPINPKLAAGQVQQSSFHARVLEVFEEQSRLWSALDGHTHDLSSHTLRFLAFGAGLVAKCGQSISRPFKGFHRMVKQGVFESVHVGELGWCSWHMDLQACFVFGGIPIVGASV